MNPPTTPSPGALRAANAVGQYLRYAKQSAEVSDIASIIDRETGAAELLAALKFYADPRKYEGPNQRADSDEEAVASYRVDVTRDRGEKARHAIAIFEQGL